MSQAASNGAAPTATAQIVTSADELEKLLSREIVNRASVPIKDGVLCPANFEGIQRLARFMWASGMVPKGVESEAQCMMLVAAGTEAGLGLGQIAKGCMVVNMRPSVWGDVALGLCRRSPLCESIIETFDQAANVATCVCRRKGEPEPIVRTFSIDDAKSAGLWGKSGPWTSYTKRMLQMRARAFGLRDAFPDILCGLSIAEEQLDIDPEDKPARGAVDPTPGSTRSLADAIKSLPKTNGAPEAPKQTAPTQGELPAVNKESGAAPARGEAGNTPGRTNERSNEAPFDADAIARDMDSKPASFPVGGKIRQTKHDPKNVPEPDFMT